MAETKKLHGKIAVITGGTTGIGLATAKLFVKEGAYVFITGRRQKELDEAVKAIGSSVTGVQGDISKLTDLDRLYEAVKSRGRIDVVFANAGVAEFAPLGKIRHQCEGNAIHGTKGSSSHEGWWLDYSQWLRRKRERYARLRRLWRDEGRSPLFRPNLDFGSQGPPYSVQCH